MKHHKGKNEDFEYEDGYDKRNKKQKLFGDKKRPIRNWKKAWDEKQDVYDDLEDFYN